MAERLGVSPATVLRAVARGNLKAAETTPGGHHRFRIEDVMGPAGAPPPASDSARRLMSTGEIARLMGVSQHTVIRACREGRLVPDEITPGGHRRFALDRVRGLVPPEGGLVGTGGAARAMGLTADRLRRAVNHGTVTPAAVTPGGHRRFAMAALVPSAGGSNGNGAIHPGAGGMDRAAS